MIKLTNQVSAGWRLVPLSELCGINPSKPRDFRRDPHAPTTFVPMEAVDGITGAVSGVFTRPYIEVARGYTYFAEGDIIFAKITPCMQNGKTAIVTGLTDGVGFGSTEFHVLRAKPEVDRRWIYHLVRSAEFRRKAEENFEGSAGQRRVPESFLKGVCVPFPEHPESYSDFLADLDRRMRAIFQIRHAAERQLEASDALEQGFLVDLFPFDSVTKLPKGWSAERLSDLSKSIDYGLSLSATRQVKGPRFVRITDIQDGKVNWDSVPYCGCSPADAVSAKLDSGDILFARTGATTGKSFLIQDPPSAVFASYLIRVKCFPDRILPEYLYAFFQSKLYWQVINKGARGGAQAGFNATMLGSLVVPLPMTNDEQIRMATGFRTFAQKTRRIRTNCERQLEAISALPAATLREFFNLGEKANG